MILHLSTCSPQATRWSHIAFWKEKNTKKQCPTSPVSQFCFVCLFTGAWGGGEKSSGMIIGDLEWTPVLESWVSLGGSRPVFKLAESLDFILQPQWLVLKSTPMVVLLYLLNGQRQAVTQAHSYGVPMSLSLNIITTPSASLQPFPKLFIERPFFSQCSFAFLLRESQRTPPNL